MTVESFFELYAAIFGWQQYNQLWDILTGTGLAYLPFLIILLLNIIGPITSQETRDAATTSVKRMEVDLFIAFTVVVLAAAPAIDLNASVLTYKKPCDTISGPAGTFAPGSTRTTFDAVFSEVIATSAQVPVWWWGIMAISSGINREAIAHIGCPPDLSGFQMEIARTRIQDPQLLNEVNKFVRYCYRPARARFEREQPDVAAILTEQGPEDLEWIGSHALLDTTGYYDNPHFRPREGIRGWPLDRTRDTEYPDPLPPDLDPAHIGRPVCNDWRTNPERGLRGKLLGVIEPGVLGTGLSLRSEFVIFEGSLTEEKVEDALLKSTLGGWQQDLTLLRFPAVRPDTCHGTIEPLAGTEVAAAPETPPAAFQNSMDQRPSRAAPAPLSVGPPEPPEPAVGSPDPPAAVGRGPLPPAAVPEAGASAEPIDLGQAFLAWLKQGIVSGDLAINTVNARVHRVREGMLIVSPGIFRDYANAAQAPWANVQKRFQKLRLHRKTPEGFNIWTYTVVGERRTRELKGLLVEDPEKALKPGVTLPPPNPHVVLADGKKG